jgi:hypothetical protein
MQQPYDPTPPAHFAQYPGQSGYVYGSQPPAQPPFPNNPASYPEKLPVQGSPPMSSPSSASQDFRMSVPPYSPATSELASGRPVHELAE